MYLKQTLYSYRNAGAIKPVSNSCAMKKEYAGGACTRARRVPADDQFPGKRALQYIYRLFARGDPDCSCYKRNSRRCRIKQEKTKRARQPLIIWSAAVGPIAASKRR